MSIPLIRDLPDPLTSGAIFLLGGGLGGLSALTWTTIPFTGGALFGGTCAAVGFFTFCASNCHSRSQALEISRIALAIFAGVAAGMAAASFGGVVFTIELAAELLSATGLTTFIFLLALTQAR